MIIPRARFAGEAKGRLAADNAISALYFTRTANTVAAAPGCGRGGVEKGAVAAIDKMTAMLAGQISAHDQ
jgi:hypothetical protein